MSGPARGNARSRVAPSVVDRLCRKGAACVALLAASLLPSLAPAAPLPNMPQDYYPLGVFYQPAVAVGDILYYAAGTPLITNTNSGVRFGYALGAVSCGATTTISVKIGY